MKKWSLIIFTTILVLFLMGCNSIDETRLRGIVDACYTAKNYGQYDKINIYLQEKQKRGEITEEGAFILKTCIEYEKELNK